MSPGQPAPAPAADGESKPCILFVDADASALAGLRRVLHPMRHQWDMRFSPSAREALDVLAAVPVDVIVTNIRMPAMDGGQLLAEVTRRYPEIVRIVLSGYADRPTMLRSLGTMHQYLAKPCDAETLTEALARACSVRDLLGDGALKRMVSGRGSIPSLPVLYTRLLDECRSRQGSLKTVGEIVAQDPGMTAKVLHLVNSAFFGLRRRVSSPIQAVQLLGMDTVKALALLAHVFSRFEATPAGECLIPALWNHSLAVATFARLIALAETGDQETIDDAGVAGLLHDTGCLVLASTLPDRYDAALTLAAARGIPLGDAEEEVFGATHAAVGAYLLALWALPDAIVEGVAFHHAPAAAPTRRFAPLTAVHAADALAHELAAVGPASPAPSRVDLAYLADLGLADQLPLWRDVCRVRIDGGPRHE